MTEECMCMGCRIARGLLTRPDFIAHYGEFAPKAAKAVIADRWWPAQFKGPSLSVDDPGIVAFLASTTPRTGESRFDVCVHPTVLKGGKRA